MAWFLSRVCERVSRQRVVKTSGKEATYLLKLLKNLNVYNSSVHSITRFKNTMYGNKK